jgi:PAS domain S-box-containing protein
VPDGKKRTEAISQLKNLTSDIEMLLEHNANARKHAEGLIESMRLEMEGLRVEIAMNTAMIESANDAFVIADENGTILRWNPAATAMFGWTKDEIVGKNIEVLIPPKFKPRHHVAFSRFKVSNESALLGRRRPGLEALHKDGHSFPVDITLSAFVTLQGRFVSAIVRPEEG